MSATPASIEVFQHIRVVMGIVLGLGLTRLLTGLARFIQHPNRYRVYPVHIGWALTMVLTLIHFWWWEFRLTDIQHWTFEVYLFLIAYSTLLFLLCTLLFPEEIADYSGYEEFFISRRKWFFGIFAATILIDVLDTMIKGSAYYAQFSTEYLFRVPVYLVLCAIAIWTPNRRFHQLFVAGSLIYQITFITRLFNSLS